MDSRSHSSQSTASAWQRVAPSLATFILIVLAVGCLYWARPILIPIAVALLLTFMLGPAAAWLQRRGLPRVPSVLFVVALASVVVVGALSLVASQVVQLVGELPEYQENVAKRVAEVRERGSGTLLANVQRFVHEVATAATGPRETQQAVEDNQAITVRMVERAAASSIAAWLRSLQPVAESILLAGGVFVLLVYLLIFREDLRSRVLVLVGRGNLTLTTKALDDAERRISRYLLAQFGLNFTFGVVIGLGLTALGVPHAPLWGFAAGTLRYIPYLGPWMAATLPVGMTLLISEGWWQPLSVLALFAVCEFSSNLVVEPWVYGQSIGVSQAAIIIAVIFWTWLWGPMGMMLAAPLTVCLVVLGKHVPALKFFDILLGDEPVLTPDVALYQRLLARDEDEAAEIVRQHAQSMSPVELCDRVLIPVLVNARHDLGERLLSSEEYESVLRFVALLAEQQDFPNRVAADRAADGALSGNGGPPPLTVLACAAKDGAETTALMLLEQLLDPSKFHLELVSAKQLVSEVLELVEEHQPAAICISVLPPGGLAHTRHLCKRLRGRYPQQKVLIGRWGARTPVKNRDEWAICGTEYIGTTLGESIRHLEELAQFLRPPRAQNSAA
jgi:predicted PurR-regulated permease PerM